MFSNSEIDAVLADFATSFWLKDALRTALDRDPVDAANDSARLAALLEARAATALDCSSDQGKRLTAQMVRQGN